MKPRTLHCIFASCSDAADDAPTVDASRLAGGLEKALEKAMFDAAAKATAGGGRAAARAARAPLTQEEAERIYEEMTAG